MIGRYGRKAKGITPKAADEFGLNDDVIHWIITNSVGVEHPKGNRRYGNLVFLIKAGYVEDINLFDERKGFCKGCYGTGAEFVDDESTNTIVEVPCYLCSG